MKRACLALLAVHLLGSSTPSAQTLSKAELLAGVRAYRQAHEREIIEELYRFLSVPNIETDRVNMRRNAELLREMMERRGIRVRLFETPSNPIVYGELIVPGTAQTVMFYAHYDGVVVNPSQWTDTQPFVPVLRRAKLEAGSGEPKPVTLPAAGERLDENWRIYARSASDDKSPIIALFVALDALRHAGFPLTNNLRFIFEGEEESGSKSFPAFVKEHEDLLKSDVFFICDGPVYYSGAPTLWFGVRGSAYVDITVYGANVDLHSGHFTNFAPSAALRLARLLASMKDPDGRVAIKGFYDTVEPLGENEQRALETIAPFKDYVKDLYGFSEAEGGGRSYLETLQQPGLNVRGLRSGWVGEEARVIIPATATASLNIQLVKGTDPDYMVERLIDHIKSQGYHVVTEDPDHETRMRYPLIAKVTRIRSLKPSRTAMNLPISRRIIDALTGYSETDPVLIPSMGSGIGIFYPLHDELGVPVLLASVVNHDNNQHGPNENLRIGHLWAGIETFAALMMVESEKEEGAR